MSGEIAAKEAIVYCRTDTTTPTSSDQVDGLDNVEVAPEFTTVETTYIGNSYETQAVTTKKIALTLGGNKKPENAPQALLFASLENGTPVYVTVINNPSADAGSQGHRYCVTMTASPMTLTPTALQTFSFTAVLTQPDTGSPVTAV